MKVWKNACIAAMALSTAMKDPAHDPIVASDTPNSLRAERQVQMWVSKNKFLPCLCNLWSTEVGVLGRLCEETFVLAPDAMIWWRCLHGIGSANQMATKENAYKMGYLKASPDNLRTRQHADWSKRNGFTSALVISGSSEHFERKSIRWHGEFLSFQ